MNGITGLDAERSKRDIDNFRVKAWDALFALDKDFLNLMEELSTVWASPKAVEFSSKYCQLYETVSDEGWSAVQTIVANATRAFNILAVANGLENCVSPQETTDSGVVSPLSVLAKFVESRNGITGMNVSMVKDFLIPTFVKKLNSDLKEFENLPKSISFYDNNGELQSTYSSGISSFVEKITAVLFSLVEELKGYLETETETILLAKQQAQDTLSA